MSIVTFRFEIGDLVQHRLENNHPEKMFVVERRYAECSGGGQIAYVCRHGVWNKDLTTFNEIELMPWTGERAKTYNEKAADEQQRFSDKRTDG